jgi:hypothetical protein
MGARRE